MPKRILTGKVVKKSGDKTISVLVTRQTTHPVYKKIIRVSKKYLAHDSDNKIIVGAYEYQSSSLAVISSLYEGFGFPAAEAMACGTPIISSNSSALPEIVQDFGQLYEPGNSDALKDCIENFYLNRSSFNDLAKKGSQYASETFNWEKIALDYERQFLETIEKFNSC